MDATIRPATSSDVERLLPHIREFWAFEKLPFDDVDVRSAIGVLLATPSMGCVFVAEAAGEIAGYAVLTFGCSLEHGGLVGLLDELYVRAELRGSGIGQQLIDCAVRACRDRGATRLQLEVDNTNPRAAALYERLGFAPNDRRLLTRQL